MTVDQGGAWPGIVAYVFFSFTSLAAYEAYREKIKTDKDGIRAFKHAEETRCIIIYEGRFMKPIFKSKSQRPDRLLR